MTPFLPEARSNWARVLGTALWAAAGLVIAYHLALEVLAIPLAEPMGKWESVYASILRTWPHEYQWGNFLAGHDNYGPGYPAFCVPFVWLLGDPYVAGRTANLAALVLACALFMGLLRSNGCPAARTAAWTAVFFAVNAGSYSIQTRPDFLVMLEVLAILCVGQLAAKGRMRAGAFGVILGLLTLAGYLTKPYVVFESLVVLGYLGLQGRHVFAASAAAICGGLFAAGITAYARANPYYWLETFASHVSHASLDGPWFVHQCADFFVLVFAAFIGGAAAVLAMARRPRGGGAPGPSAPEGFWLFAAAAGAGALVAGLGWHTGAYLTYYFHLLLAPLCLLAACAGVPAAWRRWDLASGLILLGNLAVLMILAPRLPREDPGWEALRRDILAQPGVVLVDSVMEPVSRERSGAVLADSGMYGYALGEISLLKGPRAALEMARSEGEAFERSQRALLSGDRPSAIYLDCYMDPDPRAPGGLVPIPRNGLAWFADSAVGDYRISKAFQVRPYYFSTNARRQFAGTWQTTVLKLVPARTGRPRGTGSARP